MKPNPWRRVLVEKLIVVIPELVRNLTTFYGIRKLFSMFTGESHLHQSLGRKIRCAHSIPISERYILILFYLHLSSRRSLSFWLPRQNTSTFLLHSACQTVNLRSWYSRKSEPCPCGQRRGVCGRSPAGIAGSNPTGCVAVCGCVSLVNAVRFQVEVSATGRSLVQRNSTECAIRCNNNSLNFRHYFVLRRAE